MIQRGEETLLSSRDSVQRRNPRVAENEGCGEFSSGEVKVINIKLLEIFGK